MILITGYNSHQAPLGELTTPLMEQYAKRHRLGFRCVRFEEPNVKEAYWKKITLTLQAFDEGFDRVFWLDADQMITNGEDMDFAVGEWRGFSASRDWGTDADEGDFSMCGYLAHVEVRQMFQWVNDHHDEFIDGSFPEQTPMRLRAHSPCWRDSTKVRRRRLLNAVPDEVSPGNVPEPWQPGDFAAHLTMLPIAERVTLFHKIMERISK